MYCTLLLITPALTVTAAVALRHRGKEGRASYTAVVCVCGIIADIYICVASWRRSDGWALQYYTRLEHVVACAISIYAPFFFFFSFLGTGIGSVVFFFFMPAGELL